MCYTRRYGGGRDDNDDRQENVASDKVASACLQVWKDGNATKAWENGKNIGRNDAEGGADDQEQAPSGRARRPPSTLGPMAKEGRTPLRPGLLDCRV